jgi:hypothetical protein
MYGIEKVSTVTSLQNPKHIDKKLKIFQKITY